jgi:uncharacterized protein involved in exopolysaccharide biosynthesis
MEEPIDLRSYIEVLRRHWWWMLGLAVAAGVAAFVLTSLQPASYEASSVIVITEPRYRMQFDPRFATTQNSTPDSKAFPTLATSDDVLQKVVDAYTPTTEAAVGDWRLAKLRGMIEATSPGDPSLLVLEVRSQSPQDASGLANTWADVLVETGNRIFGDTVKDVGFFEEQVAQAAVTLDVAEAALVEFEARNQAGIIGTQLEAMLQAQADYLYDQHAIGNIVQDIHGLREQLARQQRAQEPDTQSVSFADSLTALLLQIRAFDTRVTATQDQVSAPIELRIDNIESLSNKSAVEQIAFLDGLVTTLSARADEIDAQLADLEPQMLALQQGLQQFTAEKEGLARSRQLASETYLTLARKLDEARIAAQEDNGTLQVGSYAAVPERPVGPHRLRNAAMAALLGLMLGVLGVLFSEYWRRSGTRVEDTEE